MSKQEQDAILFSIRERYEQAKRKLVALKDKAEGHGREYARLAKILEEDPGLASFAGCMPLAGRGVYSFNEASFRIGEIVLLIQEIHDTEREKENCRKKLDEAGLL